MNHRINFSIKSKLIELQQEKQKRKQKQKQTNKQKKSRRRFQRAGDSALNAVFAHSCSCFFIYLACLVIKIVVSQTQKCSSIAVKFEINSVTNCRAVFGTQSDI